MENQDKAIIDKEKVYGNKTKAVPVPQPDVGLEHEHSVVHDLLNVSEQSDIDTSVLNSFLDVSRQRDKQYSVIDQMCQDSIPSAILELYTEDTTATNDENQVVWATSADPTIQKTCKFILDSFQVNKNIYKWANSLIKYGDVYLKLFKRSEFDADKAKEEDDDKLRITESSKKELLTESVDGEKEQLNEDINLHLTKTDDHFVNYAEMVDNPATIYELTRYGKTAGFIRTHLPDDNSYIPDQLSSNSFRYKFNQNDVDIFEENTFVHGTLDDNVDRISEEVEIIRTDPTNEDLETSVNYKVKSGRSVFYSAFKIWRELTLLETSLIMNRVTKSSITRIVQVEVGNIDKNETKPILQSVKQMIEQKAAIDPNGGLNEYNSPGPVVNNIYIPTKDGKGAITTSELGSDYDPKQLTDIDYFKNKFYGTFGIPKQFFGDTDDGAGFNGGQSLTIISSKYAKKVIKIQTALCEMVKSLVNIIFIDRGLTQYINKFSINMLKPITQEDIDRADAMSNKFRNISDTISLFSDIENKATKLKLIKALIPEIISNAEVLDILDEEIARLEGSENNPTNDDEGNNGFGDEDFSEFSDLDTEPLNLDQALDLGTEEENELGSEGITELENNTEPEENGPVLPTPGETGVDLINNAEEI